MLFIGDKGIGKRSLLKKAFEIPERLSSFYIRKFFLLVFITMKAIEFNIAKLQGKTKEWSLFCYDSLVSCDMVSEQEYKFIENLNTQVTSNADIIFLCYSCNDKGSFLNLNKWKELLSSYTKQNSFIYLLGTKNDLEMKVTDDDLTMLTELLNFDEHLKTSAFTGENVQSLFSNAVRKVEQLRSLTLTNTTASESPTYSSPEKKNNSSKISTYFPNSLPGNQSCSKAFTVLDEMNQDEESKGRLTGKEIVNKCLYVDIDDIDII